MSAISSVGDFYAIVNEAIRQCRHHGHHDIADQLEEAKTLGSSGLEIVGAIGGVFGKHSNVLKNLLGSEPVENVRLFVQRCYRGFW